MNESKNPSREADEQFWAWLRSAASLPANLIEEFGDPSAFHVMHCTEVKHTSDGVVPLRLAIEIVSKENIDTVNVGRLAIPLPASLFSDDEISGYFPPDAPMIQPVLPIPRRS